MKAQKSRPFLMVTPRPVKMAQNVAITGMAGGTGATLGKALLVAAAFPELASCVGALALCTVFAYAAGERWNAGLKPGDLVVWELTPPRFNV
jgi:hypothetical protein